MNSGSPRLMLCVVVQMVVALPERPDCVRRQRVALRGEAPVSERHPKVEHTAARSLKTQMTSHDWVFETSHRAVSKELRWN